LLVRLDPAPRRGLIGRFLRWRHTRASLQLAMLALAASMVAHGFLGPSLGALNLATVLTWVHYRGLLIVALLVAGNLACTACPIVLVRDLGRRLHRPRWRWPRRLRGKWIAIGLMAAVLFVYEWQDLWAAPRGTAWLLLAYFALALLVDLTFSGAAFCKHVCPIGQFNMMASTLSPLEVRVDDPARCGTCRTHDCIRGRRHAEAPARVVQRGCELGLFLPAKVGNLDCTLCLDCVQACPHDNVVLAARPPAAELARGGRRSGLGRIEQRADLAVLALVFAFGALLNALAMTGPMHSLAGMLAAVTGVRHEGMLLLALFVLGLFVLPLGLAALAGASTRRLARSARGPAAIATAFSYALLPLGVGVWGAHYGFHLLTGGLTVIPLVQRVASGLLGFAVLGQPRWTCVGLRPGTVYPLELGLVLLGAMGSLATAHAIARRDHPARAGAALVPWATLILAAAAAAVWILSQPMAMRGTLL
jgi:ferredoxin